MFFVSKSLLYCLTLTLHLTNPPLPLPILAFFDFFVKGKFECIKNHIFFLKKEYLVIFFFKKFFKNFFKNLK